MQPGGHRFDPGQLHQISRVVVGDRMTPSQRSFTVSVAIVAAALIVYFVYDAIASKVEWWLTLIFILAVVLIVGLRYWYWMMVLEERERKAAKKSE